MKIKTIILTVLLAVAISACGINSVTKEELLGVKVGSILVYRYNKSGDSWFYADKITRIEGDTMYFIPGKMEANKGSDARIRDFLTDRESSITKDELLKFSDEQGAEKKKIIWIE